jgi:hypothetical protein
MEVKAKDVLPFLDVLVMKRGPKLAMKVYQKPTDKKSNHPYHVKNGVIHGLISRVKIICYDKKDFNKEINNIRYDLMLNKYPQQFVDSIMKPSRCNGPSSETIYQCTDFSPYFRDISKKFGCTGNSFNVRTIFRTKHTLMDTDLVRDVQQIKQCVYNIPWISRAVRGHHTDYSQTPGHLLANSGYPKPCDDALLRPNAAAGGTPHLHGQFHSSQYYAH